MSAGRGDRPLALWTGPTVRVRKARVAVVLTPVLHPHFLRLTAELSRRREIPPGFDIDDPPWDFNPSCRSQRPLLIEMVRCRNVRERRSPIGHALVSASLKPKASVQSDWPHQLAIPLYESEFDALRRLPEDLLSFVERSSDDALQARFTSQLLEKRMLTVHSH